MRPVSRALWIAILLAVSVARAAADDVAGVTVTPVTAATKTATGQPILLPQGPIEVRVWLYEIAVGTTLPVHKHPHPRYAYVLAGSLRVTDEANGRAADYKAGDFIVEMIDAWHYGTNIGSEPVRLLVIDQAGPGEQNTVVER
jgi:quercetin dioxygenase-like cupin family protein